MKFSSFLLLHTVAKLMQFIFQVLFKNLGVDIKDVNPTHLLKVITKEVEGNLFFFNKDIGNLQ